MALIESWESFIRIHGGDPGARSVFEKALDELLRAENPNNEVHLVKASQGDGGIDVYVHQINGIDIYQCKFFMGSMNSSRWAQIRKSFDNAMRAKGVTVLHWYLCMPREMQKEDIKVWNQFLNERASNNVGIKFIDGNEIIHRMETCDRLHGTDFINRYFSIASQNTDNKSFEVSDKDKDEDEIYKPFVKELLIYGFFFWLFILLRFYCKYFYENTGIMPTWLDTIFSSIKNMSVRSVFLVSFAAVFVLYLRFYNSVIAQCYLFNGFTISEFKNNIHDFTKMLYEKEDSKKYNITIKKHEEITSGKDFEWTAERDGLVFSSINGSSIDYMCLNYYDYKGALQPLCLSKSSTKNNAYRLLTEQGFQLIWQNERKACYKKDTWTVLLFFGGIMHTVALQELFREEEHSLFEQIVQVVEAKSNDDMMEFNNAKAEWKTLVGEIKNGFKKSNSEEQTEEIDDQNKSSR